HFRKEALPLRAKEGVAALPMQLGSWICVREPHTVNDDPEHECGTDKYEVRWYVYLSAMAGVASVMPSRRGSELEIASLGKRRAEPMCRLFFPREWRVSGRS